MLLRALPFVSLRGTECRGNPGGAVAEGRVPLSAQIASSLALLAMTEEEMLLKMTAAAGKEKSPF